MIIIDPPLLKEFRSKTVCEWCRRVVKHGCQPHHVYARGLGGGSRLDIRINLIALCHECHRSHHDGNRPMRCDLLLLVAQRENTTQDAILCQIWELLRNEGVPPLPEVDDVDPPRIVPAVQ